VIQDIDERLEKRLGRLHARLRLGIEADHEAQVFGQGINYFHIENLPPSHIAIRSCLKLTGLYGRGRKNAARIELRSHDVISSLIPKAFDGLTILQISDLHVEMSEPAMTRLAVMLPEIDYDLCVLTGDYRAQTFGPYEPALAGMARICSALKRPVYGVLGNHDTIRMVPGLEDMGIQMLLNEISGLSVTVNAFTWPVSMARTITVWTILRRLQPEFLSGLFRSCYRTRPKSTSRRLMPISACSSAGTPTVGKFASQGGFRSLCLRSCHATWVRAHGSTVI
jgi:hypothetical protein